MQLKQNYKAIILTIACFAIYLFLKQYFSSIKEGLDGFTNNGLLSYTLTYFIIGIPIFIGTYLINPKLNILKNLGLSIHLIKPFLIALLFSTPMIVGGFLFYKFQKEISIPNLIAGSIVIGFVEELFFRGFLFGQIFKYTRLGFLSSILVGAVIFASGHLYQSQDFFELIGIFSVTFMGAILFAWLYVEWNYNLWVPIFLHSLMNLTWHIFEMDETALGGLLPNVLRGLTIILAIVFTVLYKRKKGQKLTITKDNLIVKNDVEQSIKWS
ncbi:MAG: CPBP family intramembrane glutamic endopeptidase [Chitinophagales bacterium]|nr:CPBP family intramembrane metalloprotease [Bacteroidota bacterium]MCB9042683.1 CPBP family intramembrane metalloprotease [Chitinophagales bacterium]